MEDETRQSDYRIRCGFGGYEQMNNNMMLMNALRRYDLWYNKLAQSKELVDKSALI